MSLIFKKTKLHHVPFGGFIGLFLSLGLLNFESNVMNNDLILSLMSVLAIIGPSVLYVHRKVKGTKARKSRKVCFSGGLGSVLSIVFYINNEGIIHYILDII